jgi:DNA-binding NarL/FixJ family response regulator
MLRSYITNFYEKPHLHSRTEAVVKYLNRPEPTRG